MSLSSLNLPLSLSTPRDDVAASLFNPVLKIARNFDVAVGYFSTAWLKHTAEGMAHFAKNGGESRWVISPELSEDDMNSLLNAQNLERADYFVQKRIERIIDDLSEDARYELTRLIAEGVLDFRIAVPRSGNGMMHAKIMVAEDSTGALVGVSGSYNFTGAAGTNWEHVDVFRSEHPSDHSRIVAMQDRFESLWRGDDPAFDSLPPSEDLRTFIVNTYEKLALKVNVANDKKIRWEDLRDYQLNAIESWGQQGGRGVYELATGSGKTFTALATIQRLCELIDTENQEPLFVVVTVPLKHLVDQWSVEAQRFGFAPIKCYEDSLEWRAPLTEAIGSASATRSGVVFAIVTNATLGKEHFQRVLQTVGIATMIVGDEAHNLGSSSGLKSLPDHARYRLALSATPKRHKDEAGTQRLFDYFGETVAEFTLANAIDAGYLCPYTYSPNVCEMSVQEYLEFQMLAEQIAEAREAVKDGAQSKELERLIGMRTDLLTGIDSKLFLLRSQLEEREQSEPISHTLVYCGSAIGKDGKRHIERTISLLGSEMKLRVERFTSLEKNTQRAMILEKFARGDTAVLAAIKCLDEGVDIPQTKYAHILASTSNPREYIQRRGRVLRLAEGKKSAEIFDYIVVPPGGHPNRGELLESELIRAREFADDALNRTEVVEKIEALEQKYFGGGSEEA